MCICCINTKENPNRVKTSLGPQRVNQSYFLKRAIPCFRRGCRCDNLQRSRRRRQPLRGHQNQRLSRRRHR